MRNKKNNLNGIISVRWFFLVNNEELHYLKFVDLKGGKTLTRFMQTLLKFNQDKVAFSLIPLTRIPNELK